MLSPTTLDGELTKLPYMNSLRGLGSDKHLKLIKWTENGPSTTAKFGYSNDKNVKSLQKVIRKCVKKTQGSSRHKQRKKKQKKKERLSYDGNNDDSASVSSALSFDSFNSGLSNYSFTSAGSGWSGCSSASDNDDSSCELLCARKLFN